MYWEDIKVKISSFFDGKGFSAWTKAGDKASLATANATRKATMLAGAVGSLDGPLGKAANGVAQVAQGFATLGPIGASIAGLKLVIDMIGEKFVQKANAMKEAAEKMGERVRAAFDKIKSKTMEEINDQLAEATTRAAAAANRFDALASAYMKVAQAKDAAAKAGGNAKVSGLALEKSRKMSAEKNKDEKALIGADYDVRIAEESLANTRDEQDRNVSNAQKEAKDAAKRSKDAQRTEREAQKAVDKAGAEYDRYENAGASKSTLDELKRKKDEADKALEDATNRRIKATADATAASHKVTEAEQNRVTAVNNALVALNNARDAQNELKEAQKESARAQKERAKAELEAAKAAQRKAEADGKAAQRKADAETLTSFRDNSAAQFDQAFDLWRDPEAAQQAVDADKKRGEDMKAFRKAVNRYGGKGKIDEYAQLMRAGDEEGMQERLTQWRKSSKFTPQVEQMVKAAAADQNRNAAEKSLANIEKNTADLAKKIDQLLSIK